MLKQEIILGNNKKEAGEQVMINNSEKRKFKRLSITLDLSCRKVDSPQQKLHTGRTINVSPAGLFFETTTQTFKPGNLVKVELSVPPKVGLLEFGGKISGLAKVLRAYDISGAHTDNGLNSGIYGVALEFCQPLKFL